MLRRGRPIIDWLLAECTVMLAICLGLLWISNDEMMGPVEEVKGLVAAYLASSIERHVVWLFAKHVCDVGSGADRLLRSNHSQLIVSFVKAVSYTHLTLPTIYSV